MREGSSDCSVKVVLLGLEALGRADAGSYPDPRAEERKRVDTMEHRFS
jgi:hypothetical protein